MCLHRPIVMVCLDCTIEDLANLLIAAKFYYYGGEPIMTDTSYDWLENKIKQTDPKHPCLSIVGSDVQEPPHVDYSWIRACKLPMGEDGTWKGTKA